MKNRAMRKFSKDEISSTFHQMVESRALTKAALASVGGDLLPELSPRVMSLAQEGIDWAEKGFILVNESQLIERLKECAACPFWDKEAFSGTGKCEKCGCSTQAKLRLALEKCPIGKWGPVEVRNVDAS